MKEFKKKIDSVLLKFGDLLSLGGTKKDIALLIISGISLILSILKVPRLPFDIAWVSIILCGLPIVSEAIIGLITEFDIKADVLVSIALIASVCIGEDFAAGEVAFIMQLGGLLEELTVSRARAGIEKLVKLTPRTARRVIDSNEEIIPAEDVIVGDILRVLPGETVPADGVIISGQTSVNQAVMTGESVPVDKTVGDEVISGTVNRFGAFEMRAERVGEDSSVCRMIKLVQSADASKAKIVSFADRFATWIVVIALTAAGLTWLISGEIIRAVTILVVFCPCALVLATPTAIMAGIGNCSKHGLLVREGDALERLAGVKKIAFDKTGTLTHGSPKVTDVVSVCDNYTSDKIFELCAAAEQLSEHPIGKAVVDSYKKQTAKELSKADNFKMIPGRGVSADIEGAKITAGNLKMLNEEGVDLSEKEQRANEYLDKGCTVVYIAVNGLFAGFLALSDELRDESSDIINSIEEIGVRPVLLTGDNERVAAATAKELKIDEFKAGCMPEDKLGYIKNSENAGDKVCMIGDGINDAPALKASEVGIAMGALGSDIAADASDIVISDDSIKEIGHLFALSKHMMTVIKINMTFSMALNFLAITLAILGILNPVVGALVHNAGSVLVIINSALLLNWKRRNTK